MNPSTLRDRMRREVREAVFCACRQRMVGAPATAEEWLATEMALLRVRHGEVPLPESELLQWQRDDEASFAQARLTSELLAEQLGGRPAILGEHALPAARARVVDTFAENNAASSTRVAAEPAYPLGGAPAIADLLQDMLDQEQRPRARPS